MMALKKEVVNMPARIVRGLKSALSYESVFETTLPALSVANLAQ